MPDIVLMYGGRVDYGRGADRVLMVEEAAAPVALVGLMLDEETGEYLLVEEA